MNEQEPLFPTSHEERKQMQEALLDNLEKLREQTAELKRATTKLKADIAASQKRNDQLEALLRQSRPRVGANRT